MTEESQSPAALAVDEFLGHIQKDLHEPSTSDFLLRVCDLRFAVNKIDEGTENDKSVLIKTRKLVKSVVSSGIEHANHILSFCDYLEKLGQFALESDITDNTDVTAGLCKFAVVHRDLANMSKHLMQNMNSILVYPLETFLRADFKADLKKPFEKAMKEYEYKYDKLRKEKVQTMKETGIFTPEAFTAEMTEDLVKERRKLQLEACDYFLKVNELKAKRSADLLQHLVDLYYTHSHYLQECLGVMDHFGKSMTDLTNRVNVLRKVCDSQKLRLIDTREEIRAHLDKDSSHPTIAYGCQPTQVNRSYGTKKSGFLLKKSDGKMKRIWQRRRVRIGDGELCLYHADESKPPVRLPLLTCQIKLPTDHVTMQPDETGASHASSSVESRSHFVLVSNSRTYKFQVEDDREYEEWIHVITNAMQEEFQRAMNADDSVSTTSLSENKNNSNIYSDKDTTQLLADIKRQLVLADEIAGGAGFGDSLSRSENGRPLGSSSPASRSGDSRLNVTDDASPPNANKRKEFRSMIQASLRSRPGNDVCADCGQPDPEWVSVNLGVIICLECCGTHRELGVHCSRTQSLLMDDLSLPQLLLPRFIGNTLFNAVYESCLPEKIKPVHTNTNMLQRRAFIRVKYLDRRYAVANATEPSALNPAALRALRHDLFHAVKCANLAGVIKVFAKKLDLMTHFQPGDSDDDDAITLHNNTSLHLAIEHVKNDRTSLHLPVVQFILQNSAMESIQRTNEFGETALHYAARCGSVDALKLLLQTGGVPTPMLLTKNKAGQTALQVAQDLLSASPTHEAYLCCVDLLRLAESTVSNRGLTDPTLESFLSMAEKSNRAANAKAMLADALDTFTSVNWTEPLKAEDEEHVSMCVSSGDPPADDAGEKLNSAPPQPLEEDHFFTDLKSEVFSRSNFHTSPYGGPFSTLPRKKGRAPHPPLSERALSDIKENSYASPLACHSPQRNQLERVQSSVSPHTGLPNSVRSTTSRRRLTDLGLDKPAIAPKPKFDVNSLSKATSSTLFSSAKRSDPAHMDVLLDLLERKASILGEGSGSSATFSTTADLSTKSTDIDSTSEKRNMVPLHTSSPHQSTHDSNFTVYEAISDCTADHDDELTFRKGELIRLLDRPDSDWLLGCILSEPWRNGLFPITHVKELPPRND